jgi:hypothetical protein
MGKNPTPPIPHKERKTRRDRYEVVVAVVVATPCKQQLQQQQIELIVILISTQRPLQAFRTAIRQLTASSSTKAA